MTDITVVTNVPQIVHKGVYTLWKNPDGGLRIQYRREGSDADDFFILDGPMVMLAQSASEGKMHPITMMREVMKYLASAKP